MEPGDIVSVALVFQWSTKKPYLWLRDLRGPVFHEANTLIADNYTLKALHWLIIAVNSDDLFLAYARDPAYSCACSELTTSD